MADSDRQEQGWSSINSRRDRAGEATQMFIAHVRHYLSSIPLISLGVIIIPTVTNLLDIITLIGPTHNMNLVEWFHLSVTKIIYHFQGKHILGTYCLMTDLAFVQYGASVPTGFVSISAHEHHVASHQPDVVGPLCIDTGTQERIHMCFIRAGRSLHDLTWGRLPDSQQSFGHGGSYVRDVSRYRRLLRAFCMDGGSLDVGDA